MRIPRRLIRRIGRVTGANRNAVAKALAAVGVFGVLVGIVAVAWPAGNARAGINPTINFQGKLVKTDGTNIPDGTYNIEFKLYTGGSGTAAGDPGGTLQWTEDHVYGSGSPDNRVTVSAGIFQVDLGSITSLPAIFNNNTIWLSINLGDTSTAATFGAAAGDGEMLPMIRFTSAPYAFNSDLLDGLDSSAFAQLSPGSAQSGFLHVTGNITSDATVAAATSVQAPLLDTASAVTLNIGTGTASGVTIGRTSTPFLIQGNSSSTFTATSGANTTTVAFTAPTANTTLNFPASAAGTYTICTTDASTCGGTYLTSAGFLARNSPDTSTFAVTAANYLYGFTNSSSAVASGVLKLDNGSNTGDALYVTASGNPGAGNALIVANNTAGSPSGNLLDLQQGGTGEFSVDYNGNLTQNSGTSTTRTINGQRISSAANFTGTVTAATSFLAPLFDTASAGTLAIGTNNATAINLNQNTTVASNKSFTADGSALFQDATNSTSAFQIQSSGGTNLLTANSVDTMLTSVANYESIGYYDNGIGGIGLFGNLVQRSEQFDNAVWTKTNASATANTAAAPDAQTTADTIHATASGGSVSQAYATAGNNTYTFSVWLKTAASTQNVDLRIDSNGTPATGTAKTVTATTTWQRFFVTETFSGSTTSVTPTIFPGTTGGTDSQTVYAWGGQLVQAGNPEVYVRTTGAAVAASAGVVSNGGQFVSSANSGDIPIIVQGDPGQTGDLIQAQNSGGTPLFRVTSAGAVVIASGAGLTATGPVSLNDNYNANTSINTGTSTGTVSIGNAGSGALTVAAGANSTINIGSNSLAITSSNFNVSTGGVLNVVGASAGLQIGGVASAGHYLRGNGTSYVDGTIQVSDLPSLVGTYLVNAPTATSDNTVNPGANNAVALTLRGSSNAGNPHILDIRDSGNALQDYFDSAGKLNVGQVIQPTSGNAIDLGLSGTAFRTGYFGTSVVSPSFTGAGAVALTSAAGSALTITGDAASTWSTTTGNLTVDSAAALQLGTTNATSISVGKSTTTATVNGTLKVGASAGTGALVNNGATTNTELALGNFATGGSIGAAASTVDIYTYISVAQTTAGQTLTIPAPTANTTYGKLLYLSNVGTSAFTVLGSNLPTGTTATLVWANTNGGAQWTESAAAATINAILNQNASAQSANFWINGTGEADTSLLTPLLDTPSGTTTLNIGTTNATSGIVLHQDTSLSANKSLMYTAGTGNFDQSASSGTFKTGTGAVSLNGDTTVAAGKNLTYAAGAGNFDQSASTGTFATGTGNVSLNGNTAVAANKSFTADGSAKFQDATNSATAFQIQNAAGSAIMTTDTTDTNLIQNPGGEVATGFTTAWPAAGFGSSTAVSQDATTFWNGSDSVKVVVNPAAANAGAQNNLGAALATGTQYTLSFYAKLKSGDPAFSDISAQYLRDGSTNDASCGTFNTQTVVSTGWTRITCTFTTSATAGNASAAVAIYQAASAARTFWLDGVQLEQTANVANPYGAGALKIDAVVTSPVAVQNTEDSTTALQVVNAAGSSLINADTLNMKVSVGGTLQTNTITPTGALTVGATGQQFTLQGNGSSTITATTGGNTQTLSFAAVSGSHNVAIPNADGTICLQSSSSCGFTTGSGAAYVQGGNNFSGTGNLGLTSADNLNIITNNTTRLTVGSGGGVTVASGNNLTVSGGILSTKPGSDVLTTPDLAVQTSAGNNLLTVASDTTHSRLGFNLGGSNLPTLSGSGLEILGALQLDGGATPEYNDNFTTPAGTTGIPTKILIPAYDPGNFGQIVALGIPSSSASPASNTARGISVFDQRGYQSGTVSNQANYAATPHQPSINVFSPDENQTLGFSWEGLDTTGYVKTSADKLNLRVSSSTTAGLDAVQIINSGGNASVGIGRTPTTYALEVQGSAQATTSVLTPTLDTATGVTLNIGATTPTTTGIALNQDTTVAAGKSITYAAGAGNFDQHNSTGTLQSGTGNVSLNGNTTVATNKSFTADGSALFQDATDSTTAFQIQSSGGTNMLTGNTVDSMLTSSANFESIGYYDNGVGGIGLFGNMLQRSEQFDQAVWTKNLAGTAATADQVAAPDGQTTADKLHTTTNGGNFTQGVTGGNNTYTFSVWLKTGSGTQSVDLRIDSNGTPATGTVKTVSATTTWQRFFVSQTFTSGVTTVTPTIFPGGTGGTDAVNLYGWGAQMVQASNPEVYVRTTGAAVAANAGVVSNGGEFISSANAGDVPLAVQGDPSQTGDLIQAQNSGGTPLFKVSSAGAVTAVGVDSGTGLIQGTGGLTLTGTTSINNNNNANVSINTGSSTGTVTIGNTGAGALALDSGAASHLSVTGANLTLSTITSGTLAVTSAAALNLTGNAASTWDIGNNTLSIQTTNNGAISTGTGAIGLNGNTTVASGKSLTAQGNVTVGTAGGTTLFKNNGATQNAVCAYTGVSGATTLNTAGKTPDDCTQFTITTTGAATITVPNPAAGAGAVVYINNLSTSTNAATVLGQTLPVGDTMMLVYDGTNWTASAGASASLVKLQDAYNNSAGAAPSVLTTTGNAAVTVQAANTGGQTGAQEIFGVHAAHSGDTLGNSIISAFSYGLGVNLGADTAQSGYDIQFGGNADRTIGVISATASNQVGGALTVKAGNANGSSTGAAGGALVLNGGNAAGTGSNAGGAVTIQGGTASSNATAIGGAVTITGGSAGATAGSQGGTVAITGGAGTGTGTGAAGSAVTVTGGAAGGTGNNAGGNATLQGGQSTGTGTGGTAYVKGGLASSTGAGGLVVISAADGGSSAANGVGPGGSITLQGGNATGGNNAGGSITLAAGNYHGTAGGSTVPGTVNIGSPVFTSQSESFTQTANNQSFNATQSDVDTYGTIVMTVSGAFTGATVTVPSPTNQAAGHMIFISAGSGSVSFTLAATGMSSVNMAAGSTATLIWNGSNWSGTTTASSLQQVYNNTSTSPASIITTSTTKNILFQAGVGDDNANVFQIGNSYAAPVLHVDTTNTATGANLANNGGVETGGTPPTGWSQYQGTGSTVTSFTQNTSAANLAAGLGSLDVNVGTTGSGGAGANNDLNATALSNTAGIIYNVSFNIKVSSVSPAPVFAVQYFKNNTDTSPDATCSVPTNGSPNTTSFFKYTCYFTNTSSTKTTTNLLRIVQTNTSWSGHIYIDNLFLGEQDPSGTANAGELQVGGPLSQGLTLFQLDNFANDPFTGTVNQNMVGSMYYSTTLGRIQCYEVDGWGSCGAAPDTNLILSPEYAGAVLSPITYNGETANSHIGTMTAAICSNAKSIQPSYGSICASGEEFNYYQWTTSQVTSQSYSIFVKYQLPPTFGGFADANTIKMYGRVSSTTDAAVYYTVYRGTTECGGTGSRTTVSTSANAWNQVNLASDETACSFAPNDVVTFEIDMYSKNNAYAYASQITFTMKGK